MSDDEYSETSDPQKESKDKELKVPMQEPVKELGSRFKNETALFKYVMKSPQRIDVKPLQLSQQV